MLTTVRDRIGATTGALWVVLTAVGNQINTSGTDQSQHPSGTNVLRDANHQAASTGATIGFVLEVLGFVAFIAFLGYLADIWRRRNVDRRSNVAGATALTAGIISLAIKLGSAAPLAALFMDRKTLSPDLAQVLNDMNGAAFVITWLPYAVFVAGAAFALRRVGMVGKPTAYIGAVIGVAGIALAIVGLNDPLNGNPMAFLLGLVWTLVVSVRLAVKPTSQIDKTTSDDAAPAARVAVTA